MLFVSTDQVKYCQVTCFINNELQTLKGISYGDKLFTKLHSFSKNEKHDAIEKAKAISLENKGHFLVILVEENEKYVIWQQNDQVKIKKPKDVNISEINLQELVTKMRNIGGIRGSISSLLEQMN